MPLAGDTASGRSRPSIWRRVIYPHSRLAATHKRGGEEKEGRKPLPLLWLAFGVPSRRLCHSNCIQGNPQYILNTKKPPPPCITKKPPPGCPGGGCGPCGGCLLLLLLSLSYSSGGLIETPWPVRMCAMYTAPCKTG